MNKILEYIFLKKEAYLFDAKLYILKSLVGVLTAYFLVSQLPLVQKDMISVLFGLMMTLEPVTITGIRSGFRQITATILGALATAVIIAVFGNNIFTVAVSISATLFLCLKINWREVSPVAIFTSIYMSQYVQHTVNGEPSVLLTFQLRIMALGIGVLIAVLVNFLFSLFFYRSMERKRIGHIVTKLSEHLHLLKKGIEANSSQQFQQCKELLPGTFGEIDWLSSLIKDKAKETWFKNRTYLSAKQEEAGAFQDMLTALRSTTHLIYDITYILERENSQFNIDSRNQIVHIVEHLISQCNNLAAIYAKDTGVYHTGEDSQYRLEENHRLADDLNSISEILHQIQKT